MPVKQISKPNLQPLVAVLKSTADRVNSYGNTLRARLSQRIAAKAGKSKSLNREHSRIDSHTAAWQAIIDALPGAAIALDASGVVRHHNAAVPLFAGALAQPRFDFGIRRLNRLAVYNQVCDCLLIQ